MVIYKFLSSSMGLAIYRYNTLDHNWNRAGETRKSSFHILSLGRLLNKHTKGFLKEPFQRLQKCRAGSAIHYAMVATHG